MDGDILALTDGLIEGDVLGLTLDDGLSDGDLLGLTLEDGDAEGESEGDALPVSNGPMYSSATTNLLNSNQVLLSPSSQYEPHWI